MADFTKLMEDLAALKAKVEAMSAPPPPADDQPAVDAADAVVLEIAGKLP